MTSPVFAVLVAGKLVRTDFVQVDAVRFMMELPSAEHINHVAVFLTGAAPLPDGFGATVHLLWPLPTPTWKLLGALTNDKPSAVYKFSTAHPPVGQTSATFAGQGGRLDASMASVAANEMLDEGGPSGPSPITATIGISLEPLASITAQLSTQPPHPTPTPPSQSDMASLAQRAIKKVADSLLDHVGSYVGSTSMVSFNVLREWHAKVMQRASIDPGWIMRE
ncbi:DUF775-domain-containing protein [Gonapodya prolifera JEL478]|uniref:DUF775-domain-containing protein n=1 Tax=Gonapodya prolifera (strain JEL478) TaxID=1344416 RepID=A0A139AAS2_GONPJ|nr:DUF775-domain-containing protein [Gonapodya prolifera JEL478]|eukprot:KXS13922.1 DUF775-domain-containing protein [Gonapodya prolifera JEL478]